MIADTVPDWFEVITANACAIEGRARLPGTVWADTGLALHVRLGPRPSVREAVPGTALPRYCPERHLFDTSDFCMALAPRRVSGATEAVIWWDQLAQYVACQSAAELTGLWPEQNGLDHGYAGALHARALDLAQRLGILEEYYALHSGATDRFPADVERRLAARRAYRRLIITERMRRRAIAHFEAAALASGVVCCGTMRNCPFPKEVAPALPPPPRIGTRAALLAGASPLGLTPPRSPPAP